MDVIVVGAGMAGLSAAFRLQKAGRQVVVLDKAKGVGGRMATRRLGGGVFDHGAQFFTIRDASFARLMGEIPSTVMAWGNGFVDALGALPDAHRQPRFAGTNGMTTIAKGLATNIRCELQQTVRKIQGDSSGSWQLTTAEGLTLVAKQVLLTCPIPQSLALLEHAALSSNLTNALGIYDYEPCFALMAVLAHAVSLPNPGAIRVNSPVISWIADNQQKGISPLPAYTLHASATFSKTWFDADQADVSRKMLEEVQAWLPVAPIASALHRWRYATPVPTPGPLCRGERGLYFAGDAFSGGRVEGAARSGLAAAEMMLMEL